MLRFLKSWSAYFGVRCSDLLHDQVFRPVGNKMHYEYKFADKQRALDSLARHLQMFKDTVIVENVFRIVNEMDDDELDRRLAELERAYGKAKTLDPTSVH